MPTDRERGGRRAQALSSLFPSSFIGASLFTTLYLMTNDPALLERIREKSLKLTEFLMSLIDDLGISYGFTIGNPREAERRGGHVAVEHVEAARICKALKARGVTPDFRMPSVIRLAPVPLYNTFHEVWRFAKILSSHR